MNVYIWTSGELKNAYIGEYIEETFTISNVPNNNSNVYVNIAKSWKTVKEVTFELTANNNWGTSSSERDCYFRISWSNNTTNRYGWAAQFYNGVNVNTFKVLGRINNNADTEFKTWPSLQTNWINTLKLVIGRDWGTKIVNWASESWTYTTAEKNIVDTIMNSSTINAYASREWWVTISTVNITVTYS